PHGYGHQPRRRPVPRGVIGAAHPGGGPQDGFPDRDARAAASEYEGGMTNDTLSGRKIVVTGVTGQVARPLAISLARDNEVYGGARFTDGAGREALESAGVRCVVVDLAAADVSALPADAEFVLNFAVAKTNDWEVDLAANL